MALLVSPGSLAIMFEIVAIGDGTALGFLGLAYPEGDVIAFSVSNRFFFAVKGQANLLQHIRGGCISHEWFDRLGCLWLVLKHP